MKKTLIVAVLLGLTSAADAGWELRPLPKNFTCTTDSDCEAKVRALGCIPPADMMDTSLLRCWVRR